MAASSMRVFIDISEDNLLKRTKMIHALIIIIICQITTIIINCAPEGASMTTIQGAVKKKSAFVSTSKQQEQNGFRVSSKLCLNLCSRK